VITDVLVIGGGISGMKASLLLASAGRHVHLVESSSVIGGRVIRSEDIFPAMECATCMVSPMQQEVLRNDLIDIVTLGEILSVDGSKGNFRVRILKKASCVDPVACIGCAECWNSCPIETSNEFEENLSKRKAISIPCAGALPNVPWIDREQCLRWNGDQDCSMCADACVFAAVDYSLEDMETEIAVSDIILSTGFEPSSRDEFIEFKLKNSPNVFTASEFERCYASNGPTSGELLTKDGRIPGSTAIIVHTKNRGNYASINTMYSLKFLHYLKEKLPDIRPVVLLDASYSPDALDDKFHQNWRNAQADVIEYTSYPGISACGDGMNLSIACSTVNGNYAADVDLLILGTAMLPSSGTTKSIELLCIECDNNGFAANPEPLRSAVLTSVPGIYIAGCAGSPSSAASSVTSAAAAVGRILAHSSELIS